MISNFFYEQILFISLFFIRFNIIVVSAFKNDSVKSFIDKSIELIKSNSIHTENLGLIKSELYTTAKDFSSVDELAPL